MLFSIIQFLNDFVIIPTFLDNYGIIAIISDLTALVVFLSFFCASCKDPGHLKPLEDTTFLDIMDNISHIDLCSDCKVIRTARSRHCAICNHCVERFDHHCPWINNCVGIKNHNMFFTFLLSIWVKILFHIVLVIYSMNEMFSNPTSDGSP